MRNPLLLILLVALASLAGCDRPSAQPRYQLVTTTDGKIYRLDIETGAVHFVSPDGMFALYDRIPMLRKDGYYEMEDAKDDSKFLKYLGEGQFEKSKWAIRKATKRYNPETGKIEAIQSAPEGPPVFIYNPKTGERRQLNRATNQWEPVK